MIEVGNIVTLENNQEYLLLEELTKNNQRYLYAVRTLEDESLTDEYIIFEAYVDGQDEFLKIVEDKELYDSLFEEFRNVIADKILNDDTLMSVAEGAE